MDTALIVFAKVPRPGEVKTRLTPVLTAVEAARLYEAFLRDALQLYVDLPVDVRLYLAPPLPDDPIPGRPSSVTLLEQEGEDLGTRMKNAFRETLDNCDRAVIVGTDHPTLPARFIRKSFAALEAPGSICIGPTDDGGFYLLGMNALYSELFDGMSYSHADVFTDTLARIGTTEARLTVLPQWYDVDTPAALRRLVNDLKDPDVEAPRTRETLAHFELSDLSQRR